MYLDTKYYCYLESTLIKMKRLTFIYVERYYSLLQQYASILTVATVGQSLAVHARPYPENHFGGEGVQIRDQHGQEF